MATQIGLRRTYFSTPSGEEHHESPLVFKRNVIMSCFKPHPMLSRQDASAFVMDYLVFDDAYLEPRDNRLGGPLKVKHSLAKYTRRGVDLDQ